MVSKWWLSNSIIASTFISFHFAVRRNFPFAHLYRYGFMDSYFILWVLICYYYLFWCFSCPIHGWKNSFHLTSVSSIIFLFLSLFIFEKESMQTRGARERDGDIESEAGSRLWAQSLTQGLTPRMVRSSPDLKSAA